MKPTDFSLAKKGKIRKKNILLGKISLFTYLLISFFFLSILSACTKDNVKPEEEPATEIEDNSNDVEEDKKDDEIDYGTISFEDIVKIKVGESVEIVPVFSKPEHASAITYTFNGQDISITGNQVKALVKGKTVTVTAKTKYHTATFLVNILASVNENIIIEDINAWTYYAAVEFFPKFNGIADQPLEYVYDKTQITIDTTKKTVRALKSGNHIVLVYAGNHLAEFTVNSYTVDQKNSRFVTTPHDKYKNTLNTKWKNDKSDNKTTLFVGDSFFDVRSFWKDFYTTYSGKNVQGFGINSTTSYDWEIFINTWSGNFNPKNIVVHIGTNNIYDDFDTEEEAILALQRLFVIMHGKAPDAKIYYFGITQRSFDTAKIAIVSKVNTAMEKWCAQRGWIKFLNTPPKIQTTMLLDKIHVKPLHYNIFTDELRDAGIVIENKVN